MKKILFSILLILTLSLYVKAQVDDLFWMAPPSSYQYALGQEDEIVLVITAMQSTTVTIEQPATGWSYTTPIIGALESYQVSLGAAGVGLSMSEIETPPQTIANAESNPYYNGLKITSSPGLISVAYKLTNDDCQEQISLKGENALGTDFYVSTQNIYPNGNPGGGGDQSNSYNGFTIVATEDCEVTIEQNAPWSLFPGPTGTHTLNMRQGQTFSVRSLDFSVANHINGVHITSTEDIAITFWDDDAAKNQTNQNNWKTDFAGDQLIPTSIIGEDYIVMKGGLINTAPPADGGERIFVTATEDNTLVEMLDIDGNILHSVTLNAGEVENYSLVEDMTYVRSTTDKPIYINHYTGILGSQPGKSLSAAVLPPVGVCTGSHDVVITRTDNPQDAFMLNMMAVNDTLDGSPNKNMAAKSFTITTPRGVTAIPETYFFYSHDSAYVFLDAVSFQADMIGLLNIIDVGEVALIQNRIAKFHLGVVEGHFNRGAKYGYFSDYGGQNAHAGIGGPNEDAFQAQCSLNPIRLAISGGSTYRWWIKNPANLSQELPNSSDYLSDLYIAEPIFYPDTFGQFYIGVESVTLCGGTYEKEMLIFTAPQPTAYFTLEAEEVCSPDSVLITPNVSQSNSNMDWYFNNAALPGKSETSDIAVPFYQNLPENNGDTLTSYTVTLQTNFMGACSDIYTKTIIIKPAINSDFEFIGDSVGCHPLDVSLKNFSTGNVDSTSYLWLFGDNTISYEIDSLTHSYSNYGIESDSFLIQLVTRSPYDCLDTAMKEVIVYPRVKALFSSTPNQACSPLVFDVNPVNTVGADTLLWNLDYFYNDSSFIRQDLNAMTLTHYDTSVAAGPDTLQISLIAKNDYGCADTALPHTLVTYPASIAEFTISDNDICDGDSILFENNSDGYNLDFYWNLGDGTAPNDSTPAGKPYFNPSSADITYPISLTVVSDNNCLDTKDTVLTVHPFIDANFGLNFVKNCSPLAVNLTDNAFGADIYNWDLGDGNTNNSAGNFTHYYFNSLSDQDTNYYIKLVVENNEGCSDSISRTLTVKPQVVAAMNLDDNLGCSPLSPSFENLSQGGSYYIWNLGGNNIRTDTTISNFNELYVNGTADDMTYPISLTAMNTAGCDSTVYDTVQVFADIISSFSFAQDSSCSPFLPEITNTSGGGAKIYDWYRDGVLFSNDEHPVLPTYTNLSETPESYLYTLVTYGVNDAPHLQCADTHSIPIRVFPELQSSFNLGILASCQPLNTPITNTSNLQDSTQFIWYMDSYVYSSVDSPGTLFINNFSDNDATHTIRLTGQTNHGCTDTTSIDVDVYAYIDANFTIDKPEICSGDSFSISRYNTRGAIDDYLWNFDGTNSNRTDAQFSYSFDNINSSPEIRPITLTVSNANCDSTWTGSIQVNPLVTANFNAVTDSACHPFTTAFNNSSLNAENYRWSFGDGVSSSEVTPTHSFINYSATENQSYDIQLIAESSYRCSDTVYGKVTSYAKPIANFIMPISVSCPPFNFSVINSSEGSNLSYNWNLGGTVSSDFEPTQTFTNSNTTLLTEEISLEVTSENGCIHSITQDITIYPEVNVDFTTSPTAGCSPLTVQLEGDTTNVQQLVWYVDGNLFSAQIAPSKQFINEMGDDVTHNIELRAYSRYNCVDSSEGEVTVYATPVSDFGVSPVPAIYDTLADQTLLTVNNFTRNQSSWDYNWNFGDGNSSVSNDVSFTHTFGDHFWGPKEDNFRVPVRLISANKNHPECQDTIIHEAMVIAPVPLVEIGEEISGCIPLTVDFTALSKYANSGTYEWNFGDGTPVATSDAPTHIFNKSGTYTVKLNVEGDGGPAADYKVITVYPQPIADFSFNDTVVYVASQTKDDDVVNFYNQTKYGINYEWFFDMEDFLAGSNPDSDEKDPVWAYDDIGVYYPVLVAYSGEGCSDTLVSRNYIRVLGEGILEFPSGFYIDQSMGPADEYNTSQITPNMHVFYPKNSGVAKYKLEVYNRWGTLVFETNDVNQGWNGYIDGIAAKQDVYIWRAKGSFTNGQPFDLSGDITLFHSAVNTTR